MASSFEIMVEIVRRPVPLRLEFEAFWERFVWLTKRDLCGLSGEIIRLKALSLYPKHSSSFSSYIIAVGSFEIRV